MFKKFTPLILKTLFPIFLFIFNNHALANDCVAFANETADDFLEDINDEREDFEKELNKLKQKYFKLSGSNSEANFELIVQKQKERVEYPVWSKNIFEDLPAMVRRIHEHKKDRIFCDEHYRLEKALDLSKEKLEEQYERLVTFIDTRVGLEELDKDQGLVVIAAYAYGYAQRLQIKSKNWGGDTLDIGPITSEQWFEVVKLSKGEYYWDRIEQIKSGDKYYWDLEDRNLSFSVQPGKINLTGAFVFEDVEGRGTFDISDRVAIILKILEDNYPLLMDKYDLVNGLVPSDPFPAFFKNQKAKYSNYKEE
ncbi:hypothetical protein KIH87_00510 [Paraneptunicella aestuarii]|uniref:hypothetical protein n=1 Tax=Paraneptunicella aestuarii TaxID=2831148 RepID=UPI001E3DC4D7|nr:hypothetical protein [Paraneptunicella aestuarii]UAA38895.1 hypothetical protein KIH87_00510 [Paraneptunicella aestuarii]